MPTDPILTAAQLGRVLHSARKSHGLTQAEVAAQLGLSQKRVSALEHNPASLTADQLLRLCAALGLELAIVPKPGADKTAGALASSTASW